MTKKETGRTPGTTRTTATSTLYILPALTSMGAFLPIWPRC